MAENTRTPRVRMADVLALLQQQQETITALLAAQQQRTARATGTPRAESPSQVMFRTRTAGTCPSCGRADFRTVKGALGHLTTPSGDACARTPERDAGILAQHPEAPTAAQ